MSEWAAPPGRLTRDADRFAAAVDAYAGMVYGTALRITGDVHDAEDVAQVCFLEFARKAGQITSSIGGWLHRTATTRALDALRNRAARRRHERGMPPKRADPAEPTWHDVSPMLDQVLEELPDDLRAVVVMRYLQGLGQQAIAEKLGTTQSTVSRRLEKGLEHVRGGLRRMGVIAPCALLATWLTANAAPAAPAALRLTLGKMSLVSIDGARAVSGGGATGAPGAGVSRGKVGLVAALAAGVVTIGVLLNRSPGPPSQEKTAGGRGETATPPAAADARSLYVAPGGDDAASGSIREPLRTIGEGVKRLQPGDHLVLRGGRYHETVEVKGVRGTAADPVVIEAFAEEQVVLDGTLPVTTLAEGPWALHRGGVYTIRLTRDIWQLIADGELQTSARWPNAFWHDESLFDLNRWAMGNAHDEWYDYAERGLSGYYGTMGNTPDPPLGIDLKRIGFDLTGAVAILNVANYDTYSFPVIQHDVQAGQFTFRIPEKNQIFHKPMAGGGRPGKLVYRFHKYFFEGKLELLDAPTEWYYDTPSRTLYYYPPAGKTPSRMDVRGKVQTYALEVKDCQHLALRGIDFFGTTLRCIGNRDLTLEDCRFFCPSYSRRALGDWRPVDTTVFYQAERKAEDFSRHCFDPSRLTLRNCRFECADGDAVKLQGTGNVIENCYFHKIDYSCVDEATDPDIGQLPGNGGTVHTWWSPGVIVRRCTIDLAGEAHGFMGGKYSPRHKLTSLIEYCRATRCGRLHAQDGANFHIWQFDCDYTTLRYNWASDTVKYPFRLDGIYHADRTPYLDHCLSYRLVAFDSVGSDFADAVSGHRREGSLGISIKGDYHRTYHTTSLGNSHVGLFVRNEGGGGNSHSDTRNNASMRVSGGRGGPDTPETRIHGTARANWSGFDLKRDIREVLRDADNLDFRPREGSPLIDAGEVLPGIHDSFVGKAPDLGAYEYGDANYWIPGYQSAQASTPIPVDGTKTAKGDCDLMWLGGYRAVRHDVHVGTSRNAVTTATRTNSPGGGAGLTTNLFAPGRLVPGRTYFWRVDAVGTGGEVVQGPVWSFTVGAE